MFNFNNENTKAFPNYYVVEFEVFFLEAQLLCN